MISVEDAKELILKNSIQLSEIEKNISESIHYVLSQDVISPLNYPPFDQSAMDGFAIKHSDFLQRNGNSKKSIPLEIIGESAAGIPFSGEVKKGSAVRIFTGAKLPAGMDSVIVQEKVFVENGRLIINENSIEVGSNIRRLGSQIKKGEVILKKGHIVNPGTIGLLASLGITKIKVSSIPRVALIVTGNELVKPGNPLNDGQVYESNSYCILAAFKSIHIDSVKIISVGDDEKQIKEAIKSAIETSDLVLATGGISVGKYDFVGKAFHELGVKNIFYKISQKPGKPLFFGKLNSCLIFGLPGNPAASLSCFYEYVFPAVKIMQGCQNIFLQKQMLPLSGEIFKKEGLALFLKGKIINEKVEILPGQESSNISSFSEANCLIYLPAQKSSVSAGELAEVHILP